MLKILSEPITTFIIFEFIEMKTIPDDIFDF
jgi:hypothetical protein